MKRRKDRAKQEAEAKTSSMLMLIKGWWSAKYQLPASSEEFESQTLPDLYSEMLVDYHKRLEETRDLLYSGVDGYDRAKLKQAVTALEDFLDVQHHDSVTEQWDKDFDEGRVPEGFNDGIVNLKADRVRVQAKAKLKK